MNPAGLMCLAEVLQRMSPEVIYVFSGGALRDGSCGHYVFNRGALKDEFCRPNVFGGGALKRVWSERGATRRSSERTWSERGAARRSSKATARGMIQGTGKGRLRVDGNNIFQKIAFRVKGRRGTAPARHRTGNA